ncbi:MAG: hypothetical protein K9I85_04470 [Saprospiraceae bacterium]|nr:hypothetical protein [Saprospiraceae bacterium]
MRRLLVIVFSLWILGAVEGQTTHTFTASLFNNAVALPGGSFSAPFHPGVDIGWVYTVKDGDRWDQLLTTRLGYYNQRIVHHGIQLYSEYTWRFLIADGLSIDGGAGLGYLHTLEQHDLFTLKSDGAYERTGYAGKPHVMISAMLGLNLAPPEWAVKPFLQYRFRVMTPFVKSYVPFFPATSLHLGATFPLTL